MGLGEMGLGELGLGEMGQKPLYGQFAVNGSLKSTNRYQLYTWSRQHLPAYVTLLHYA